MKKLPLVIILCCLSMLCYSQNYNQLWQNVDSLMRIKNYRESGEVIKRIRAKAIAENNIAEKLRTILAEHNSLTVNTDNIASFDIVNRNFQNHLNDANGIEKSLLANFYAQYLLSNIGIQKVDTKNFQSQPIDNRIDIIDSLFRLSLSNKVALTKEPLSNWKTLLTSDKEMILTPTMYHLLALNYLDFLKVDPTKNSISKALNKELEQLNQDNMYRDASAYLIFRPYLKGNSYYGNQADTLLKLLPTIESEFNAHIYYVLAKQKDQKEAVDLLKIAKEKYPKSPWINNVDTLLEALSINNIHINVSSFVPQQEYTPIQIRHKNTDKLYIRVYDISTNSKLNNTLKINYDSLSHQVSTKAPLIYEEFVPLKKFDDPYEHSTNYKINPLPYGRYQIIVSNNIDFKDDGIYQVAISSDFQVSDVFITAYEKKYTKDETTYSILLINRKSGKPYAKKNIELFTDTKAKATLKKIKQYKTTDAGEFMFKSKSSTYDIDELFLYLPEEKQWINLDEIYNIPELAKEELNPHETNDEQGIIMTDRAIYRPGQPVHFKAILYTNHFQQGKIAAAKELKVSLKDANNQEIKTLILTTNTFGSINGTFDLPTQTLNGYFQLELLQDNKRIQNKYFSVEEYKRPTFKVTFEPNKNTYTKSDTAIFIGKVESLTGVPIPNSTIKYTINISSYSPSFEKKIEGSITSDVKGEFSLSIPLTDSIYQKLSYFNISIHAEAKSPSEEIQKAFINYYYNDQPKVIRVSANSVQKEYNWKTITVETTNTNGFPLPFQGLINIYKYESINLPLGDMHIDFKDGYDILDTLEYQKYFPNYYDKALHQSERRKTLIASYPFDTHKANKVSVDSTLFGYGEYLVEGISIVSPNDTLRNSTKVKVFQTATGKFSDNTFLSYSFDKNKYHEKDTVGITFYSDVKDVQNLFLWKINGTDIQPANILPFAGGKVEYKFVVAPFTNLPTTSFEVVLVKDNKIKRLTINIPYEQQTKKNINIITKTFRDKITPGQKEKWSFTILQNNTKAEVLATLYDSSIDQFAANYFPNDFYLSYPYFSRHNLRHITEEFGESAAWKNYNRYKQKSYKDVVFPQIRNYDLWSNSIFPYNRLIVHRDKDGDSLMEEIVVMGYGVQKKMAMTGSIVTVDEVVVTGALNGTVAGINIAYDELNDPNLQAEVENLQKEDLLNVIQARTNLQETAFFYPELYTDEEGNISFEFDTPEALTKWKLLLFAHTKDLQSGNATYYTHTQKQLMVQPNLPRFMRVGDKIVIKSLVNNLSEEEVKGVARLQLIDPKTNVVIQNIFTTDSETKDFTIAAKNNNAISWTIAVPEGYPTVFVKVVAATDEFSDGEQHELAIIPNDILISETQKIVLDKEQHREYNIASSNRNNVQAQIIIQANPILEILSSLEYLKNYPYECAEQTASKWFGIKIIQYLQKNYPAISTYFSTLDSTNITSSMREKASFNELSLEEMPWLRSVVNDEEKLKQLALLFNSQNSKGELQQLEERLNRLQKNDGSFVWFEGGSANLYISTRLLEIFGKVYRLDNTLISKDNQKMISKLKSYLNQGDLINATTPYAQIIDYAYAHQYWSDDIVRNDEQKAWILKTLRNAPLSSAKQPAGTAAKSWIVAHQYGLQAEANAIFNRLDQEYVIDSIAGIYWSSNDDHYNTVSLHTYLMEAYKSFKPQFLKGMADWLFYAKTHNNWRTTWMSVDAIYALLVSNNPEDFTTDNKVAVWSNNQEIAGSKTGVGQVSKTLNKEDLKVDNVLKIENNNNRKIYGSIIHQYFLPLEEVKANTKDIAVSKHILVFRHNKWVASNTIKSGEKVKIRLEVISNKNLNFVHLKDSRAAGFEPEYRPSGYQFRKGGYYFTNKDASTNYFIDYLPKGTHIYEYEVKTNNIGLFNTGISQIECMYDPSVNARTENFKIEIKE